MEDRVELEGHHKLSDAISLAKREGERDSSTLLGRKELQRGIVEGKKDLARTVVQQ